MAAFFLGGELVPGLRLVADLLWAAGFVSLVCLPIAAGIAILRHRLYNIDVVINCTLVYGTLTASLAWHTSAASCCCKGSSAPDRRRLAARHRRLDPVIAALFSPLRRRIRTG
jgi:hypothetical protein